MADTKQLVSLREAAGMGFGSPQTLRRHILGGDLAAVRVGGSIRIRREALEAYARPYAPGKKGGECHD